MSVVYILPSAVWWSLWIHLAFWQYPQFSWFPSLRKPLIYSFLEYRHKHGSWFHSKFAQVKDFRLRCWTFLLCPTAVFQCDRLCFSVGSCILPSFFYFFHYSWLLIDLTDALLVKNCESMKNYLQVTVKIGNMKTGKF